MTTKKTVLTEADLTFSCPDWEERLEAGKMPIPLERIKPLLNKVRAKKALQIYNNICCPDVPGQPLNKDASPPWLKEIIQILAGGLQESGEQIIQKIGIEVPKKNSKTNALSAMTITLGMISVRPRAEILLLGAEQGISQISFKSMQGMILADDYLREIWHIREHLKRIEHRESGVTISVKSFSMESVTGTKPTICLIDEAHLLTHPDSSRILGQITGGMASIPEAQLIWISTQSDIPPKGFWLDELTKMRAIRDGTLVLPRNVACLYEPPKKYLKSIASVSNPELWKIVNPSIGYSISLDWLKASYREAIAVGEQEAKRWLSQHGNVQVSDFQNDADAWTGANVWHSGAHPGITIESIIENCDFVSVSVDGGGYDDILSIGVIGVKGDTWYATTKNFIFPIAMDRRLTLISLFQDFMKNGDLELLQDHQGLDPIIELIEYIYNQVSNCYIGMDPSGLAPELAYQLKERGISEERIVGVKQGFALKPGFNALERKLRGGYLRHADQEILNWAVSNTKVDPSSNLITKKFSGVAKIDPIVSLAIATMVVLDKPSREFSIYAFIG
jgi:phage terminase large subunit-like protein